MHLFLINEINVKKYIVRSCQGVTYRVITSGFMFLTLLELPKILQTTETPGVYPLPVMVVRFPLSVMVVRFLLYYVSRILVVQT